MITYLLPTCSLPLATLTLSQDLATTISKGIFTFLHTSTYPKKTGGIIALTSLIIPPCQNHYLKFTNYLMNICLAVKNGRPYQKQNFSSLITKENKIKRGDKSKYIYLFKISRCTYFGTRALLSAVIIENESYLGNFGRTL